ncbi:MAG: ATP-binding domain-containing protein [bacterium]
MALARHVLGPLAPPRRPGTPAMALRSRCCASTKVGESVAFLADALKALRQREPVSTVALVARQADVADLYWDGLRRADIPALRRIRHQEFEFSPGADLTDVFQIKGLEYDYVVVLEATAEHWPTTLEARHLLHVAMTRAAHQLWLLCAKAPSPLLPAALVDGEAAEAGDAADAVASEGSSD